MDGSPDPKKMDIFAPDAAMQLDRLVLLLGITADRIHAEGPLDDPIRRGVYETAMIHIDSAYRALVALTSFYPLGGYDYRKRRFLAYARGYGQKWIRATGDLEKKRCDYERVGDAEGDFTLSMLDERGIVNMGKENVLMVENPSRLLDGKEKAGIAYTVLQAEHDARTERKKKTSLLAGIAQGMSALQNGGPGVPHTLIAPLSKIDLRRRDAAVYVPGRRGLCMRTMDLRERTMGHFVKTPLTLEDLAPSAQDASERTAQIEKMHPKENVYLTANARYPFAPRTIMNDAFAVLCARFSAAEYYAQTISLARLIDMQPRERKE